MADSQRRFDRNSGLLPLPTIPDDKYIAGAVVVLMDERGNYTTQFVTGEMDALPDAETQEHIGKWTSTAFEVANLKALPR